MDDDAISAHVEQAVQQYFEDRPDWTVTRLDTGTEEAADFRVCHCGDCFLCEVKTIHSVLADIPYSPAKDYLLESREQRRAEIEEWMDAHPDERLLMFRKDREFVFGDETEAFRRHQWRRRHTEAGFRRFGEAMQRHFEESGVRSVPATVRLDSGPLYVPLREERRRFFAWLESEIRAIAEGNPSRWWEVISPWGWLSAFYPIHEPRNSDDVRVNFQLTVMPGTGSEGLVIQLHCYGTLNIEAITRNVEKAVRQLRNSAERDEGQDIARVVILAFVRGIPVFNEEQLEKHIAWMLNENPNLSAIAVLRHPPTPDLTPEEVSFAVLHNPRLGDVAPLGETAFGAESVHIRLDPEQQAPCN